MKKKVVSGIALVAIIIFLCGYLLCDEICSKILISHIERNDVLGVEKVIKLNRECVNSLPQVLPKGYYVITEQWIMYPLTYACENAASTGNLEIVDMLISAGADVNSNVAEGLELTQVQLVYREKEKYWYELSTYLINHAAEISNFETAKAIIVGGENPEDYEKVEKAFLNVVEKCEGDKADWDDLFCYCALYDRCELMQYLINNHDADINAFIYKKPVLCEVVRMNRWDENEPNTKNNFATVQFLLDNGANIQMKSEEGKNVMDYALETQNEELVDLISAYN